MKKFLLPLFVIVFLPVQAAHAQLSVVAPGLEAITTALGIDQAVAYAKQIAETVQSGVTLVRQLEHMAKQAEQVANNLSRMGEIHSWNDFMSWYNRQLYLERQTIDTVKGMGLTVGGKHYNFTDMEGMAGAVDDTFVEFWNKEFTEEQRREVWTSMGLTPANYVYVQTWKEKEMNLARRFLASSTIQNDAYMQNMIRNNKMLNRLAGDLLKPMDEKMDDKEIQGMAVETAINTNKDVNDIKMMLAEMQELQSIKLYQENTPYDEPAFSEDFDKVYFRPLK